MRKLITILFCIIASCETKQSAPMITDGPNPAPIMQGGHLFHYATEVETKQKLPQLIQGCLWRQISGPSTAFIETPSKPKTVVSNLVVGEYKFEFSVWNQFGIGRDCTITTVNFPVLTVQFISINGKANGKVNEIGWTYGITEPVRFFVQKSLDNVNFKTFYEVNSNSTGSSHATDETPGAVTYYRVMQLDLNGKQSVSYVVAVSNTPTHDQLIISDNPARQFLWVNFISTIKGRAVLYVISSAGNVVMGREFICEIGPNRISENIGGWASGIYSVVIIRDKMKLTNKLTKIN